RTGPGASRMTKTELHTMLATRTATNAFALTLLAGTVLAASACGPRRAGFWNKNKNPAPAVTDASVEQVHPNTRSSAFYSTSAPAGRSGLASNTSATINQTVAAESSFTYAAGATGSESSPTDSAPGDADGSGSGVESAGSQDFEPAPANAVATATDPSSNPTGINADTATNTAGFTPDVPATSIAPTPNRSEDLSAIIYASAMGAELPTEFASPEDMTRATLNVRQITASFAGSDFDPTPTPDGKHLVFASTQHRPTADIYMKPISSSVVTRLTDDPAQDVMPSVSPDGQYIAYCSDRNGSWDVFVMSTEGGKSVQITTDGSHDLHPTWSPDGTHLAFCRLGQQTGRWEMWVAEVANPTSAQFIGFGLFPEWSPISGGGFNGADQILFQRSRERGDRAFSIWTIDYNPNPGTAGRETEIATAPDSALINPSWSPNGNFVTFAQVPYSEAWASGQSAKPESSILWMMGVDGAGKVRLTDGDSIDLMPTWSRQNEIFFVSNMGGQEHLWSMELSPAIRAASVQMPGINGFANAPTGASESGE
ncbi:MAG: DPP IV N-terminal domain-containing protein, partial [Planctomycetota bacterium]